MNADRQRLLEKLMKAREMKAHNQGPPVPTPATLSVPTQAPKTGAELKAVSRLFYDNVSRQLNASEFRDCAFFLNYGYVSDGAPEFSTIRLPQNFLNRNSTQLVLEVIGDADLAGRQVLDVGCGRGGTAYVVHKFFKAARFVGLDLSADAIEFCRQTHSWAGFSFVQGDAEDLPFEPGEFDVALNIESSHNYPDILAFYRGLFRVLRGGGRFLYADNLALPAWDENLARLRDLGFVLERVRDITRNVVRSCDENARLHRAAFQPGNDARTLDLFLAVPGSPIYNQMKVGQSAYRILSWTKPL